MARLSINNRSLCLFRIAEKLNYSGEKKRYIRKHIAAVDEKKRILTLNKARERKVRGFARS